MDIMNLVEKLEELFSQGWSVPMTNLVVIQEDKMLDIIDQMRISIPDEVKRSQQVLAQRDRIISTAKEEAERSAEIAREKREQLTSSSEITAEANNRAKQIISQAHTEADVIRREADKYALESLKKLEQEMERSINQVRNGIKTLQYDQEDQTAVKNEQ